MKLKNRFSLRQLVRFSLGGSLFVTTWAVFLLVIQRSLGLPRSFSGRLVAISLIVIVPSGLGIWASSSGIRWIRRGLMDERWPASEVAQTLRLLQSRLIRWTTLGVTLAGLLLCIGSFMLQKSHSAHSTPWGGFIYFFLAPSIALAELLKLLQPPKPIRSSTLFLSDLQPIASAHWGERGLSDPS